MADQARLYWVVQDSSGNAKASATVEFRRQGATVNGAQSGTSPLTVTVRDCGSIKAADNVKIGTGTTTYNVDSVTATTVVLSGFAGTLSLSDGDRLSNVNLPTLYSEVSGSVTTANPVTSDSNGIASAYARGGYFDVHVSGTGLTTTLYQDQVFWGDDVESNEINTLAAQSLWQFLARHAQTTGNIVTFQNGSGVNFDIENTGGFTARAASTITTGGLTIDAGGITVTGNSTITGTLTGLTGLTVASGTVSLPTGEIGTAELANNAVTTAMITTTDATDNTFTTEEVLVTSASFTVTASNVMTVIEFNGSIAINGGTSQVTLRLRRGGVAGTLLYTWRYDQNNAGAGDHTIPVSLHFSVNGEPAGAQTYTITGEETGAGSAQIYGSAVAATRIVVYEIKK